jgi:hypothetical protein
MPTRKIVEFTPYMCRDVDHNPPMHQHYTPGVWEHTCPACGAKTIFTVASTQLKVSEGEYWRCTPHGGWSTTAYSGRAVLLPPAWRRAVGLGCRRGLKRRLR